MENTNPIWECFGKCGEIESVRIVRDRNTNQTKGFGYVNFVSKDAVALALKLDGIEINNRPIRVRPCRDVPEKQRKGECKHFLLNKNNDKKSSKKLKNDSQQVIARLVSTYISFSFIFFILKLDFLLSQFNHYLKSVITSNRRCA